MKRLFLLLSFVLAFNFLNAQEVYRFRTDAPQGIRVESSTATGISLHYSVPEIGIASIDNGEAKGQEILLKGSFGSFAEGQPNLPFENHYIAVPKGATVNVKVKENGRQTLNGIDLLPAAAVQENAAVGLPKLRKDMSIFGKDANFPKEIVAIAQSTQIRGLDVILLNVMPFRYNPVQKTLEVIYDMDIEVRFEGGNGQFGEARYLNPVWYGILRDLVINPDMLPKSDYYDQINKASDRLDLGCEYLIIAPDDNDILALADTLRQFRIKQGILTKVVSVTECGGNDANAIKSYIQNAYENWIIPPAAVMLFSGVDTLIVASNYYSVSSGIPGFGLLFKEYDYGTYLQDSHYSSDNPYADMNGDSIPDIALSRLPAVTLDEYRTQVHKLIQYETNPPTEPSYYDQPIVTSSHEDNKWFLITSQSVNGFYRKKLGRHSKNFYMLYEHSTYEIPDTAWSTGYNTSVVVDYFGPNGQNYIAQQPDTLNNWRSMTDISYLVDALNQGSFLTLYRDHSSFDLWCSPWMGSEEIQYLTNTDPTFVLSIGCDAALYSKVIYYELTNSSFSMGRRPMIYEFCKTKVGALGGIGSVAVTYSPFNDILTWGLIDNFWPDYMPDMGTMVQPDFTRPAYALVAGKLFLNQHAFMPNWWPQRVTTTQNVFHYLGETYLNLYTEVPQQMVIDAEPFCDNPSQYTMMAEEGAVICLTQGDVIINITQATGQPQDIALPDLPIGETITVTVTKQNRIRFEQTVRVVSSELPFVYMKSSEIKDEDGNGQLDQGEYANIDIMLNNQTGIASAGGEITLLCDSPYIEILQGTTRYPQLGANATYKIENAFRIKVANDVPDQTAIQLMVRFNENENAHEDHINTVANAPVITIDPEFWPKTAEGEPSTHISTEGRSSIVFSVKNTGHSAIDLLQAHLDIKAPFVEVENIPQHEGLLPNEVCMLAFELNTAPNDIAGAWLQTNLDVQYGAQHIYVDTIIQYGGIFENFETDTLNQQCLWSNIGSHPWAYCSDDAYEGQRCMISTASTSASSILLTRLKNSPGHSCKLSFRYKTSPGEGIDFGYGTTNYFSSEEWSYAETFYDGSATNFRWKFTLSNQEGEQAKLDDLCFPPTHTVIAHAGNDLISCGESPVTLGKAYAYDCDSIRWTTDGDGHFESDTFINATYIPGSQDIANGLVTLTLQAFGDSPMSSTMNIQFIDGITIGSIDGDSIVNKYEHPICQYSVETQPGVNYVWTLEPANAGYIYGNGSVINLAWNLHESDMEALLTVKAENGCDVEPVTKAINLIGYAVPEQPMTDFSLFPNPTDDKVNLVISGTLQGKAVIEVYNLLGERMLVQTARQLHQGETVSLDLSKTVPGLYIIKLSSEKGCCSKKVSVW